MAIVFLVVGGVFVLAGLAGGVYSLDMLPTERGIAGTIASAVFVAGGVVTAAVGAAVYKLEALLQLLSAAATDTMPVRMDDARSAPVVEPPVVVADPVPTAPVAIEVPKVVPAPTLPDIRPVDLSLPKAVQTAPRQLSTGAALAAGAAVATAGAAAATVASKAKLAVEEALAAPLPPIPSPVRPHKQPEPELPVEVLPSIDTTLREIKEQAAAVVHPPVVEPETKAPVAAAAEASDPISDFVAELDRLIPLPVEKPAPVEPPVAIEPPVAPEPVAAAAEVEAEAEAELAPEPAEVAAPESVPPVTPAAPAKPAAGAEIVGAYESGGAKYTMYSDGSVLAEAEGQTMRFNSLEELREFIDSGHKPA